VYLLTATVTDAAGNVSGTSAPVTLTIASTIPPPPEILTPANGAAVNETSPPITGTTTGVFNFVTVTEGDDVVCADVVPVNRAWSCTPARPFTPNATHTITAVLSDTVGNETAPSSVTFTVDTIAPDRPTFTNPAPGSSTNNTTPSITGTAEPHAVVRVVDERGRVVCAAVVADGTGAWSCSSAVSFPEGPHTLDATATDRAGNVSDLGTTEFAVDVTPPVPPVITRPTDGSVVASAKPEIHGTATTGDTVTVATALGALCSTVAVNGAWECTSTTSLGEGTFVLTPTATDPAGNRTTGASVRVAVDTSAPNVPVIVSPKNGMVFTNAEVVVSGTGEPGSTVTVAEPLVDATARVHTEAVTSACGAVLVDAQGEWTCGAVEFRDGVHALVATSTDAAGNASESAATRFTVHAEGTTGPGNPGSGPGEPGSPGTGQGGAGSGTGGTSGSGQQTRSDAGSGIFGGTGAGSRITVSAAAKAQTESGSGELAFTGADGSISLLIAGGAALFLGIVVRWISRRSTRTRAARRQAAGA
jgi:hypothetical protein